MHSCQFTIDFNLPWVVQNNGDVRQTAVVQREEANTTSIGTDANDEAPCKVQLLAFQTRNHVMQQAGFLLEFSTPDLTDFTDSSLPNRRYDTNALYRPVERIPAFRNLTSYMGLYYICTKTVS